jgi:uncharacterized membrane protein YuzA (DUF378 family)
VGEQCPDRAEPAVNRAFSRRSPPAAVHTGGGSHSLRNRLGIEHDDLVKIINAVTLLIVIAGGVNWALVGIFDLDVVTVLYGNASLMARVAYGVIGLSAVWQFGVLLVRLTPKGN